LAKISLIIALIRTLDKMIGRAIREWHDFGRLEKRELKHVEHFEDDDNNDNDSNDVEDVSVHGAWITRRYPRREVT
jgi:hypothetical protein